MTRRERKAAVEMALARIGGPRWHIAMRETEWSTFTNMLGLGARNRLVAILCHFCDHGEANLPGGAFRWLSEECRPQREARQGAFEAHGVVLRGHAAVTAGEKTFFVTAIEIDPPTDAPRPPKRTEDRRQRRLPLVFPKPERN